MTTIYSYSDIDLSLSKQKDGDIKVLLDIEAVKANILNIVNTMQGSRRMMPELFPGPYSFLFEPMTESTAYRLGESIVEAIRMYEDRIDIENVHVDLNYNTGYYNISITFKMRGLVIDNIQRFNFILKKL